MKLHQTTDLGDVVRKYDYTAKLGRDRWAWEFLRRGEAFRSVARATILRMKSRAGLPLCQGSPS